MWGGKIDCMFVTFFSRLDVKYCTYFWDIFWGLGYDLQSSSSDDRMQIFLQKAVLYIAGQILSGCKWLSLATHLQNNIVPQHSSKYRVSKRNFYVKIPSNPNWFGIPFVLRCTFFRELLKQKPRINWRTS